MKSSLRIFILFSSLSFCLCALNELNDETFADHIAIGNHFVAFYAPWCGFSRRLKPAWKELAEELENDQFVSISRVDCDKFQESICDKFDVNGYPTLLWIVDGEKVDNYDGERGVEEFKAYIEEKTGVHIEQSSEEDHAEYTEYKETSDDSDPEESDEEETTTVHLEQSSEEDHAEYTEYKETSDYSDPEESDEEETTTVHLEQSSEEDHAEYTEYEETSDDSDPEESDEEETTTVHIEQSSEEDHSEYEETSGDGHAEESGEEENEVDGVTQHLDPIDEFFLIVPTSSSVIDLNSEIFQNHISVGNHFVAFLHPLRPSSRRFEAVWNELANSLQDDRSVSFSRYNCNERRNHGLCLSILRLETYLAFVWFVDGKKVDVYDGVIGVEQLKGYIKRKTTANKNGEQPVDVEYSGNGSSKKAAIELETFGNDLKNSAHNSTTQSPHNVTVGMSSGGNVFNLKKQIGLSSMILLLLTHLY